MKNLLETRNKNFVPLVWRFVNEMENRGYSMFHVPDRWMPHIIADKKNHYRIELICFEDKGDIVVQGTVGLDISSVFYFAIRDVNTDDREERFEKLIKAAEPFFEEEIDRAELRMEF